MNLLHRWYCRSDNWARIVHDYMLPNAFRDLDHGSDVLEIGPGPGRTTEWIRERVPHLTTIEIDHALAESLKVRMEGLNVSVIEGDATEMPFPDGSFSGAVCFTMLHHVPSAELQDRLMGETYRVLRPGGVFAGSDSKSSFRFKLYHLFDTCVPVPESSLASRLAEAGFSDAYVEGNEYSVWWRATKPAQSEA